MEEDAIFLFLSVRSFHARTSSNVVYHEVIKCLWHGGWGMDLGGGEIKDPQPIAIHFILEYKSTNQQEDAKV